MVTVAPTIAVIIAAAGTSSRMGTGIDKQFAPVGGKPLLWHSLRQFSTMPEVRQILVTVSPTNAERVAVLVKDTVGEVPWQVVPGGAERQYSVLNAIRLVDPAIDIVLVHDGARPFVDPETIRKTVAAAEEFGAAVGHLDNYI